jgi:hypothetical protein
MVSTSKWGDLLEDEEELPAPEVKGPDAKGVMTKVEYYRNDKGEVMKKVTKTRVMKITKKVYEVGGGRLHSGGSTASSAFNPDHHRMPSLTGPVPPFLLRLLRRSLRSGVRVGSGLARPPQSAPPTLSPLRHLTRCSWSGSIA